MNKNVWLERREKRQQAQCAANAVKFKGKFQEAASVNKQGRTYPALVEKGKEPFVDLSQASSAGGRYKEYQRLHDDAMHIYSGPAAEDLGEAVDVEYFKKKLFEALKMPSQVSKKLASEDVRFARKYERETGESLSEWRELTKEQIKAAKLQKLEELKVQVMSQNPAILGVPAPEPQTITPATALRFDPAQIIHLNVGEGVEMETDGERRIFYVDCSMSDKKSEEFVESVREQFRRRKRQKNVEAQAAESETWFTPNGPNRGKVPDVIQVFAESCQEVFTVLDAKIDSLCNECMGPDYNMPLNAGNLTITSAMIDPQMAENRICLDDLPACETFCVGATCPDEISSVTLDSVTLDGVEVEQYEKLDEGVWRTTVGDRSFLTVADNDGREWIVEEKPVASIFEPCIGC